MQNNQSNQPQLQPTQPEESKTEFIQQFNDPQAQSLDDFFIELNKTIENFKDAINEIDETYRFIFKFTDEQIAKSKQDWIQSLNGLVPSEQTHEVDKLATLVGRIESFNNFLIPFLSENSKFSCLLNNYTKLNSHASFLRLYTRDAIRHKNEEAEYSKTLSSLLKKENKKLLNLNENPEYIEQLLNDRACFELKLEILASQRDGIKQKKDALSEKLEETQELLTQETQAKETLQQEKDQLLIESEEERNLSKNLSLALNQNQSEKNLLVIEKKTYKNKVIQLKNSNDRLEKKCDEYQNKISFLEKQVAKLIVDRKTGMKAQYQQEIAELEGALDDKEMEVMCLKSNLRQKNKAEESFSYQNNASSAYDRHRFSFNEDNTNNTRFRNTGIPRDMQQSLNNHPSNRY